MSKRSSKYTGPKHDGPDHSSPYPVSRLAPGMDLVDLAREISQADRMLKARTGAKLTVIANQIKALQHEAQQVLATARRDQELNLAHCNFQRKPGGIYHLYRKKDGSTYFSMLSPDDWRDQPPHEFRGSYRLENDLSWTSQDEKKEEDDTRFLVEHLLSAGRSRKK